MLDEPGFAAQFRPPETPGQGALLTATDAILARLKVQPSDHAAQREKQPAVTVLPAATPAPQPKVA